MPAVARFWCETERYHSLAENYENQIEITHPNYITSQGMLPNCLRGDSWVASSVVYYDDP